jgi:phosphate:Na+ symporter
MLHHVLFITGQLLGGLGLFIFGINLMTDGLCRVAGNRLRAILTKSTSNRFAGIGLGTLLSFLVHSGAATAMLVAFLNAGLLELPASIPIMLGANIGTTLSMQLISFNLSEYCFLVISVGFLLQLVSPRTKDIGRSLLGFGLIFLGMSTMSNAIRPYRELLIPILSRIDGNTLRGMLSGIFLSCAITLLIQSSGATIGMLFALISAGVIGDLSGAFPIIIGANIGKTSTALLACIGTNINARRSAFSHFFFNLLAALLAIVFAPLYYQYLSQLTPDNVIHQAANANVLFIALAALLVLPFSGFFARLTAWLVWSRLPPPAVSYLDTHLLATPERAITATIRELQRCVAICEDSFHLNLLLLVHHKNTTVLKIRKNENNLNDIKVAVTDYLSQLTNLYLSHRQSLFLQHLNNSMVNIERIGDHIDRLCDLTLERRGHRNLRFNDECLKALTDLFKASLATLATLRESLNPDIRDFKDQAENILRARNDYAQISHSAKQVLANNLSRKGIGIHPAAGIYFNQYVMCLDRIVKHAKFIALAEMQSKFTIKKKKMKYSIAEQDYTIPAKADLEEYLGPLLDE